MSTTWGELAFGTGSGWGGDTNIDVTLTGVSSTTSLGATSNIEGVGFSVTLDGWSRAEWGDAAWGYGYQTDALTASAGSVTLFTTNVFPALGVEATEGIGTLSFVGEANISVTGVQSVAALGDDGTVAAAVVTLTGVEATTYSGASWGDAAWGSSNFGGNITFKIGQVISVDRGSLQAVEATAAVGDETIVATANVALTGVSTTAQLGDEFAFTNFVHSATGLEATADLGASDEEVTADAVVIEDGTSATGAIGGNTVVAKAVVLPTGLSSTAALGDNADDEAIGSALVVEDGVEALGRVSPLRVSVSCDALIIPTGVVGTTNDPKVTLWGGGTGLPPTYDPDFWTTAAA